MNSVHAYLSRRLPAAFRQLWRSLEALDAANAATGVDPAWRQYRFGYGLNGSILGIVQHVTAWKHIAAQGLATGVWPEPEATPGATEEWNVLLEALEQGQAALEQELARRTPEELEETVSFSGWPMTVTEVFAHMLEHDQYHAGQISLLRQQRGERFPE